jgi:integrase
MHLLGPTVETYFKRRAKPGRYWLELEHRFEQHFVPRLGGRKRLLTTITKADLRELIEEKEDQGRPVAARTAYESLSPFFKWCLGRDLILSNPLATLPPPRIPESRDRVLREEELRRIWKATYEMSLWGPMYRLLMLTAQRREEVAQISYQEIERDTWVIPKNRTKNKKEHIVPLSQQALEIINSRPIFIGKGVSGYSRAKIKIDSLSGVQDWRIHDLRRTSATVMQELGVQEPVVDRILNHSIKGVKGVYLRYQYLPERKYALGLLGLYLESLGK